MRILESVVSKGQELKVLKSSSQNGMWHGAGAVYSPVVDKNGHRRRESDLTHLVTQDEHGKPVMLPRQAGREPQGVPKAWRVREEGKSEGRPVMGRIGVAVQTNITPCESGQTSLWSRLTRELE